MVEVIDKVTLLVLTVFKVLTVVMDDAIIKSTHMNGRWKTYD